MSTYSVKVECACGASLDTEVYSHEQREKLLAQFWQDHVCPARTQVEGTVRS